MATMLRNYNKFVLHNPLAAMSLTTGTAMGLGNVISQTIMEDRQINTIDWPRVTRFAAFGYLFTGPFLRYWYYGLEKYFANVKLKPMKMMLVDQSIAAPLLNISIIFYLPLTSGKSMDVAKKRFREDFSTIIKANYMVWPAIQLTNFYFIPLQHRVLFVNICSVLWATFLAYMTK